MMIQFDTINEEIMQRLNMYRSQEFDRRQRQGEFWLRREAEISMESARSENHGFLNRAYVRIGDFLITFGLRLRVRADHGSPVALVPLRECGGNLMQDGWCVYPVTNTS